MKAIPTFDIYFKLVRIVAQTQIDSFFVDPMFAQVLAHKP